MSLRPKAVVLTPMHTTQFAGDAMHKMSGICQHLGFGLNLMK